MLKVGIIFSLFLIAYLTASELYLKPDGSQYSESDLQAFLSSLNYEGMLEKNVFEALLPVYGLVKIRRLITQENLYAIKKVFEENPQHWDTLMVEFSKCDVFLPTLEKSNWTAEKSDLDRIIDIFGKDATLADFFNEEYVKELEKCLDDHDTLIFLLELVARFGCVIGHDADFDQFADLASELLLDGDIINALLPTLIAMFIVAMLPFGKRDATEISQFALTFIKTISPTFIKNIAPLYESLGPKNFIQFILSIAKPLLVNLIQGK